ncbi:MAG: DUF819 family protein [Bacteroidales bacterium]|nr:DUF819 family protein [Bacteroidales bacterium]
MLKLLILVVFYVTFPLAIIALCKKWTFFKKLGTIVMAYFFGLIMGNVGILPKGSEAYRYALQGRAVLPSGEIDELITTGALAQLDLFVNQVYGLQDLILTIIVPLAIPLLLFSLDIRRWFRLAGQGFLSMILAFISVIVVIITGFLIFKELVPDSWQVAGLLTGVYTGGTPNLAAIRTALEVDPSLFIMVHTYDLIIGAFTIIFFITIGKQVFGLVLPRFRKPAIAGDVEDVIEDVEDMDDFTGMFRKSRLPGLLAAFGISLLIFAVSAGLSLVLKSIPQMVVVILSITTLGIIASLFRWINRIEKTFQLGMYLILIFSLVVSSMADLSIIFSIKYINLFLFVLYAYFGSMLLHLLLSILFRVDTDNYLITTTALIYSPPFVPVVAAALKNKDVITTGLTVGLIGYVVGNYLAVPLAYLLKAL